MIHCDLLRALMPLYCRSYWSCRLCSGHAYHPSLELLLLFYPNHKDLAGMLNIALIKERKMSPLPLTYVPACCLRQDLWAVQDVGKQLDQLGSWKFYMRFIKDVSLWRCAGAHRSFSR